MSARKIYDLWLALKATRKKLSLLKRQHEQLRVAAERALPLLGESEIAWHLRAMLEASK